MAPETWRRLQVGVRWLTAVGFVTPGVLHFTHADVFLAMMPPWLPWHLELVWVSGVFEILGGVGLLFERTRRFSAWGLLALLVAVYPANIHMAVEGVCLPVEGAPCDPRMNWVRLPFQLVIALEVWYAGLWEPPTGPRAA